MGCATWWIGLNRPCAAAMQPYVKLLWLLVSNFDRLIFLFLSTSENWFPTTAEWKWQPHWSRCIVYFGLRQCCFVRITRFYRTVTSTVCHNSAETIHQLRDSLDDDSATKNIMCRQRGFQSPITSPPFTPSHSVYDVCTIRGCHLVYFFK